MFRTFQRLHLDGWEIAVLGLVVVTALVCAATDRLVGFLIALTIMAGVSAALRRLLIVVLEEAVAYGVRSADRRRAAVEVAGAANEPGGAVVRRIADHRREPLR